MKGIKEIFGRIWALWGVIVFITGMFIVLLPIYLTYLVPEPVGMRVFAYINRWWMRVFLFCIGCPFKIYGRGNFKKQENYIVIANHQSFLDITLLSPFLPGANKTIAKSTFAKIPIFGWIYTRGSVLVNRASNESRRKSFDQMKLVLRAGLNMIIYPEGTRNKTLAPLKHFYDGAFRLAVNTQKNIIPVCILGTAKALPATKAFYLMPATLKVYVLPEIVTDGHSVESLKKQAFDAMWEFITSVRK